MALTQTQQEFVDRTEDFVSKLSNSQEWSMSFRQQQTERDYELYSSPLLVSLDGGVSQISQDGTFDAGAIIGGWPDTFIFPEIPELPV